MLLEKSLPHAPKDELDYRSYSYRLIGHIYECKEDYSEARKVLDQSLDLSPRYADGLYDSPQIQRILRVSTRASAESLERAIREKPLCWNLAQKDAAFDSAQPTITLLASIYSRSKQECEQDIAQSRASFHETNRRLGGFDRPDRNLLFRELFLTRHRRTTLDRVPSLQGVPQSACSRRQRNSFRKVAVDFTRHWRSLRRFYNHTSIATCLREVPSRGLRVAD